MGDLPIVTRDVFPTNDGTLIAVWGTSEPDRGVAFSNDDGKSWRAFANLIPLATIGPGPREVWIPQFVRVTAGEEVIRLLHTEDAGESWAEVSFSLNGMALENLEYLGAALRMTRGFRDADRKRVFGLFWDGVAGLPGAVAPSRIAFLHPELDSTELDRAPRVTSASGGYRVDDSDRNHSKKIPCVWLRP